MKNDDINKLKNNVEKEIEADIENLELEDVSLEMKVENVNLKPSNNEIIVNDNDSVMEDISDDRNDINQDLNNVDTNNSNDDPENQKYELDLDEEPEELDNSVDDNLDEFDQYENEKNSNRNDQEETKDNSQHNKREKNESNNSNTQSDNKNSDLDNNKSNSNSDQKTGNNNLNDKNNNNPNKSNNETLNRNESPKQSKSNPSQSASKDAAKDIKDKKNSFRDRMKRKDPTSQIKPKIKNKNNKMNNSVSNGAKKTGQNIANGAKKTGQAAAEGAKKAGQAAAKGAQAAGKAAAKAGQGLMNLIINTMPYSLYVIGAILIIFLIMAIVMMVVPGLAGDVNDQGNYAKFSEVDQETLEDMRDLFSKYPNADGALAISTVLYPYYDFLHSGTVENYLITDEDIEESEGELTEEDIEENVDSEEEKSDKVKTEDDRYLYPFRKKKMLNKLEEVLKELNKEDEDAFKTYLKEKYFKNDRGYVIDYDEEIMDGYKGYKEMLNNIDSSDEEKFMDLLIKEIYDNKNYFVNYVFDKAVCSTTLVDAGNVTTDELLNNNVYIDLKKPGCSSLLKCSESYYSEYLTMDEYAKGVVYEELGSETSDVEVLAAQMVAAKNFAIARRPSEVKYSEELQAYVIPMLWSTADQDFCHVEKGCNSSDITEHYGYNKPDGNTQQLIHGANRGPASAERKTLLDQAWELSKSTYVVKAGSTEDNYVAASTSYWQGSGCNVGNCMEQTALVSKSGTGMDHKSILSYFYSNYSLATIENNVSTLQTAGAMVCTDNMTNFTAERNKISSLAITMSEQNIPYYIGGLASSKILENNNFGGEIESDADGNTKKGLGEIGFVNFVFWNVIDENFGNTNDINKIINDEISYAITKEQLLIGDIGISSDNSIIAIYIGDEKWAYADSISKKVVVTVDDRFVTYRRLQYFKNEMYMFDARTTAPTKNEWANKSWFQSFGNNLGQCPWYAQNRASEIIEQLKNNSSITDQTYNKLIARIKKTNGNGIDYQPGRSAQTTGGYLGGTDLSQVKPGSFLGMSSNSSPQYGHVAIVEYVDPVEDVIIISDGWTNHSGYWDGVNFAYSGKLSFSNFVETRYFRNHYVYGYLYFLGE